MERLYRGNVWRIGIGSLIGGAASIVLAVYGQAFIITHVPGTYYYLFFFGRIPWIALIGVVLALVGSLATVYLDYAHEPLPIVVRVGAIGMGTTILIVTIQQRAFQGVPFFFDFFVILLLNTAWFLLVAMVPFLLATIILQFALGFTRRSRSGREIMPPELLMEIDQRRAKARK